MINRIGAGALLAALVVSQRTDAQALKIKYVPGPTVPTDLIYAVRISALPGNECNRGSIVGSAMQKRSEVNILNYPAAANCFIHSNNSLAFSGESASTVRRKTGSVPEKRKSTQLSFSR